MNNYERLDLYPHNIETSKKIKKAFSEGETTVSIVHATGTGKSYNALALALDHKEEKIIWIVPTNAIKEHIETTINSNQNLSMQDDFPNLEIRTYQSFINMTKKEIANIPCNLLIVDEIHHLGAPIWGERISTFIKTHENIKTFGMTAYTVRDRGTIYERDVTNPETDEIFSNSVESVYDLCDALIDGVLPKPIVKSVVIEESEIIIETKEKIEMLKRKGDLSYLEDEKMLNDVVKMIHKQNGVKELIQQTVIPSGKYIYFCPLNTEEGKNDMNSIMDTMMEYLKEKYPNQRIIFYKTTSASGKEGKHNRDCFYNDVDLEGNDCKDAIRIMFAKNQYNEGVHAPGVNGVFLGRRTRSDIVAFEHIGRGLSVRGNINKMVEEYNKHNIDYLKQLAISRGISINENDTKEQIIEKLISPIIIDLADNIEFIEELETNLGDRVREIREQGPGNKRIIKIIDTSFDIQIINKDLLNILKKLSDKLRNKTWEDWYELAKVYYNHHGNTEIPTSFKTKNGYEFDEEGIALGRWCETQRRNQKKLTKDRREKLEAIGFRFIKKKEHSDKIKEICNKYNLDYKKLKKIPYQELYAKIEFLLENNLQLQTKEGLNPIFNMSNINMEEQYGISKEDLITKYYLNKKGRGI